MYKDAIINEIDITLSWTDRLRLLVHGRASVRCVTPTVEEVGGAGPAEVRVVIPRILPRRARAALGGGAQEGSTR